MLYIFIAASCFINYCFLRNIFPKDLEDGNNISFDLLSSLYSFRPSRNLTFSSSSESPPALSSSLSPPASTPTTAPTIIPTLTTQLVDNDINASSNLRIDVVSIGSETRLGIMEVQRTTWAKHKSVRHFFAITEEMDIEADRYCYQELSVDTVLNMSDWCRDRYIHKKARYEYSSWLMSRWMVNFGRRRWLSKKENPVGWMCAQRRFARGMATVLARYRTEQEAFPDYLLLVDDDTYVNMELLVQLELQHRNQYHEAYVAAGCRVTIQQAPITNFAFGGFGQVYSHKSLERLTRPIHCNMDNNGINTKINETNIHGKDDFDGFERNACQRISENLIGEREHFQNGMSVSDLLLEARLSVDSYVDFPNWKNGGFCFHGDHYLANLVHLYGIASTMDAIQGSEIVVSGGSNGTTYQGSNCLNERQRCDPKSSMVCHYQTPSQMANLQQEAKHRIFDERNTNDRWNATFPAPETTLYDVASNLYDIHFMETQSSRDEMKISLSKNRRRCYEGVFHQLDDEWAVYVGGFRPDYASTCNNIQVLNIFEKRWDHGRELEIPKGFPTTHHAVTYDPVSKFLYVISGQMGGGCHVVSPKAFRVHFETGKTEILPDLPEGRYAAGAAIVRLPNPTIVDGKYKATAHLHVFGGASPLRNLTAREHWQLEVSEEALDSERKWGVLEAVPDSNSHPVTFQHEGYIYTGSALNNDFGLQPTESIDVCRRNNPLGVDSHHTTAIGAMYRYPTVASFASAKRIGHWERTQDMPFPAGQALVVKINDTFLVVGGSNTHEEDGSTRTVMPNTWVRAFHPDRQEWDILSPLVQPTKFGGMAWYDSKEESIFVLRYNNNKPQRPLWNEGKVFPAAPGTIMSARKMDAKYLLDKKYRQISVKGFRKCIDLRLEPSDKFKNISFLDQDEYDEARSTWNLRKNHLQLPDLITYPENPAQVGAIIQCAKRNGYKVCGRNGKHSFEGDTCAYGVVVDTTKFDHIEVLDHDKGIVSLGSGLRLGQVAVELEEREGLVFPMGHCASVGLTGLLLVGGQGVLSRHFGLTIDHISAIELVDESGRLIRATEKINSDYLWLAKGGGSGVQHFPGIVTAIETVGLPKREPAAMNKTMAGIGKRDKVYTAFEIQYHANVTNAVELMIAWEKFYQNPENNQDSLFTRLTAEVWMKLIPKGNGALERRLFLAVYFYGNDDLHEHFMVQYFPQLLNMLKGQGEVSKISRFSSIVFHRRLAGVRTNVQLASGKDGWDLNKRWKGYSAVASEFLQDENSFRILAEGIYESEPFTERYVEIKPLGGAISATPKESSAFWHRDSKWWLLSSHFLLPSDYETPPAVIAPKTDDRRLEDHLHMSASRASQILENSRTQHTRFVESMSQSFGGYYAGYIDHGNSTGRDLELYYGDHAEQIAIIKKQRDPHNVFHLYVPNAMDESWHFVNPIS
ncbi:luciferase-like protein [Nitzschia inconspicua]|uniref:Luciferase-like protein n=1 Tax=Nitzschia inconspicua TaxID=303405 RepID=A0A9K3K707_9STRA|nr:luciferase-like protein [Nitzschia inconspicua]KAG7353201.1 luciferase-like protein [Nitzschia inconspicua]